jgi:hypothetical protein
MLYKVYKNITTQEHDELESILVPLRFEFVRVLNNFSFLPSSRNNDYLEISFIKSSGKEQYNIGLSFKDIDKASFKLYATKAKDIGEWRHFKSTTIVDNKSIDYISKNIKTFLRQAVDEVYSWKDDDLKERYPIKE